MADEPSSSEPHAAPLSEALERVRSELNAIQLELDHTLGAWRGKLAQEKETLRVLLEAKQNVWAQQEGEWQQQRLAYERKIQELERFFEEKLAVVNQNALRALNELEDTWQREKVQWQLSLSRANRELQPRLDAALASNAKQQHQIDELDHEIFRLRAEKAEAETLQAAQRDQMDAHVSSLKTQVLTLNTLLKQLPRAEPKTSDPSPEPSHEAN